jgi:type II secretory pathway component PulF
VGRREFRRKPAKLFLSRLQLILPLFGKLVLKSDLARFCGTLELLIKSGIPILKAIDVAVPVINNEIIREKMQESHGDLEQGGSFGKSLKNSKLLPPFVTNLIIVGEESGRLTDALSEVAASYERDTDEAIKIMTNLLEPLMILVMGLLVGFIVVAMLLPVFEINVMAR